MKVNQEKFSKPKYREEKKNQRQKNRALCYNIKHFNIIPTCILGFPDGEEKEKGTKCFWRNDLNPCQIWWKLFADPRSSVNFNWGKHKKKYT